MLHIGWASRDTTPPRPCALRGQWHVRISTHANDPVTATALAMEETGDSSSDQAVMVSCDRVNIPVAIQEEIRRRLRSRLTGFDLRKVFLNATHTHTAPEIQEGSYPPQSAEVMTPSEYAEFFVQKVVEAVAEAWENRRPAGASWALGHAVVGHNRRIVYSDGSARMYGDANALDFEHVEGYEDHSVDTLFLWDEKRRLTGLVANLACPSQVDENREFVSADFWHDIRVELRRRHGQELFVLPQCSSAGDQSPHLLLYKQAEADTRRRLGVTERQDIAQRVALAVDRVFEAARSDIRPDARLRHIVEPLDLPARMVTEDERRAAEDFISQNQGKADARLYFNRQIIERHEKQKSSPFYTMELHVLRVGDAAFATNPFELFLDYGLRIKARSRATQTFVVQLAAGDGFYLPTERAVKARGYGAEVLVSKVGPDGGRKLVNRTVELINKLWE